MLGAGWRRTVSDSETRALIDMTGRFSDALGEIERLNAENDLLRHEIVDRVDELRRALRFTLSCAESYASIAILTPAQRDELRRARELL